MRHLQRLGQRRLALALLVLGILLVTVPIIAAHPQRAVASAPAQGDGPLTPRLWLPLVTSVPAGYVPPAERLCRFGVGAGWDIGNYPIRPLRPGWYYTWTALPQPPKPGGIGVAMNIRLRQTGPASYVVTQPPASTTITATVLSNPRAMWPIGNEPDRRYFQDDIEPQVYARAYHDLYYQIKAIDPTAQIAAGNIVEPTPLRLQYLDLVLGYYQELYREPMPVDVWSIHTYPLLEQSCDQTRCGKPDTGCWGADIPPGMSECTGTVYSVADSGKPQRLVEFVTAFRTWMAKDRLYTNIHYNYRDRPLILPEIGVLMPLNIIPEADVLSYMNYAFNYLMTTKDLKLGYSVDNNLLVQRFAWYSLTDQGTGGWLFDPTTKQPSIYGNNFAANAQRYAAAVNLTVGNAHRKAADGQPNSVQLSVDVFNNGNISLSSSAVVQFRLGSPTGTPISPYLSAGQLDGCALPLGHVEYTWTATQSGTIYAVVDPNNAIAETNETDNAAATTLQQ